MYAIQFQSLIISSFQGRGSPSPNDILITYFVNIARPAKPFSFASLEIRGAEQTKHCSFLAWQVEDLLRRLHPQTFLSQHSTTQIQTQVSLTHSSGQAQ